VTVTGITVVVKVTQGGAVPMLSVTPPTQNVTVAAGTTNFSVVSNSNWTASSNVSWCTVTLSGSGNGTIDAVYEENTGMNPRTALITVNVTGLNPVTVSVFQEGLVGMSERIAANILLYPNPSNGKFTLSAADHRLMQMDVEVVNMLGEVISVTNCSGKNSYMFDLSGQPRGNYFLRIITAAGTSIRKIIVE
jgi:hypothetical protein